MGVILRTKLSENISSIFYDIRLRWRKPWKYLIVPDGDDTFLYKCVKNVESQKIYISH